MAVKVDITHPDRVLFPDDGITKGDLVDYSAEVAGVMLPHLKERPLTLGDILVESTSRGLSSKTSAVRCRTGWERPRSPRTMAPSSIRSPTAARP